MTARKAIPGAAALGLWLQACAAPGPADAERLYREALFRVSRESDPAGALPLLDRAIRIDPGRPEYFAARGRLRRALGRGDEAAADYAAAIDLRRQGPSLPADLASLHLARGTLLAELDRTAEAEADFSEAIRLVPGFAEALLRRARLRRRSGRTEEAERDATEARRSGAALADSFYNEGVRALNLGRRDEAELLFEFAVELDPGHVEAHVARARVFMETRRFPEAGRSLDRAIGLEPARADLYYHRGNTRLAEGRAAEALSDYKRSLELDPRQASCLALRGLVYHRHFRDTDRALADYDRAIEIDPSCHAAWTGSGDLFRETGPPEEAERRLRKALEISATADALRSLGRVLLDRGDPRRAAEAFRGALQVCRDEPLRKEIEKDLERAEGKEKRR